MEVQAHSFFVTSVAFNADSKKVLSVAADYSCVSTEIKDNEGWFGIFIVAYNIYRVELWFNYSSFIDYSISCDFLWSFAK